MIRALYDALPDRYFEDPWDFVNTPDAAERDALEAYKEQVEEDMLWQD